jgi:hypothetical protein
MAGLTSGCGGPQNVVRIKSVHTGALVSGLWDGFTVAIGFVAHIINRSKYDFIAARFGGTYFIGWLVGALLLATLVGGLGYRRTVRVRRTNVV